MAPALPFAAVLAGRLLAGRLMSARLIPVAAAVLLAYVVTLGGNALAHPAPPGDQQLGSFLARHHLRYGLSGYWQADAITLAAGNQVQIRALQVNQDSLSASHCGAADRGHVRPASGPLRFGRYTVLVWHQNLLWRLS
jgi:hypothetical protein